MNASHRAWLAANPERYAEYKRKQHEAYVPTVRKPGKGRDPEKLHAAKKRRKALERGAPLSDLTAAQWAAIKEAYDLRCAYCGERVEVLTQDHVLALSKGGAHTATNIVPACKSCNSRKNDRPAPVMQMRLIGS